MRLAYSISGYKLPGQFRWLLSAIWHEADLFSVHVDAKTPPETYEAMRAVAAEVSCGVNNITFIERRSVVWMGIGLVQVEMDAIRHLLRQVPRFDYLISLSMQDYPLKSREDIVAELEANPDKNYIRMLPLADQPFDVRRRPWLMSFERGERLIKTPLPRLVPKDTPIRFKGSWWRVLSHAFCEWLAEAPETARYLAFLKNVQAPDELLFQNLIMASPYKGMLADDYRHLVLWSGGSGSPFTVTMAQWHELESSSMWFVRKVDETVDREVLERLAKRIDAPAPTPSLEMA